MTLSDNHSSIIVFEDVSLTRNQTSVLNNLSLELYEKRIGLIGLNGSGKSSMVRLINGLLQPDAGRIRVNGKDPAKGPHVMSSEVGFIFQNPDHQIIFPTVEEELSFGLLNQGFSKKEAKTRVEALLTEHDRSHWAHQAVHSLSEGQKQLVCILAVLVMEPKVLILDEPFSALDLVTRYQLLNLLDNLPQQVLMISHELDTFDGFDRVLWLEQGVIYRDGHPKDVLTEYHTAAKAIRA